MTNMDRKRRLTASSASDDATPHRRPSALSGPSSVSRSRLQQQDRPLPMLPVGDGGNNVYVRSGGGGGMPGSSRENAIDLASSSPPGPVLPDGAGSLSRQHSRSLTTSVPRQDFVEYPVPRWQPDTEVTHCPICNNQFSFWYRKHHCRKCGRVVCAACSPHRITIPRQYIVRPPDLLDYPGSPSPYSPRHRRDSSRGAGSAVGNATSPPAVGFVTGRPEISQLNPALGGGEEVRLCNPCVPDPNPDPPLTYGAVRASFDRLPDSNWGATTPAVPISQRFHQVRRSLSGVHVFNPRRDREGEEQSSQHRHQTLEEFLGRQPPAAAAAAAAGSIGPSRQPSGRGQPFSFTSYQSGPTGFEYRNNGFEPSGTRPRRVQSLVDSDRPLPARPPARVQVDERDICPICSMYLPPRGSDGNEDDREAHVRDCIARTSGSSPGFHSPRSQHLLRMLSFTATEKDCISEDGTPPECTICMEEYEVGDKLARLECLCKFHKACIVGWFERKKECPVHKFS